LRYKTRAALNQLAIGRVEGALLDGETTAHPAALQMQQVLVRM
jgi:hypothetical protein